MRVSIASPLTRPSPNGRRVGIRIVTFEACSPNDIIRRIEGYSGVKLAEAFAIPDLDREVKWHCKYARQNGIHVSPTFMIDGLVQTDRAVATRSPIGWRAYRMIDATVGARSGVRDCLALPIFRGTRESNPAKRKKSSAIDAGPQPTAKPSPRI